MRKIFCAKSLCVLSRIIQVSTPPNAWILDLFTGSSTTGILANLLGRCFLGIDQKEKFLRLSIVLREEINYISKHRICLGNFKYNHLCLKKRKLIVLWNLVCIIGRICLFNVHVANICIKIVRIERFKVGVTNEDKNYIRRVLNWIHRWII